MKVWCPPREKEFVIAYMGRQGWEFESSKPDGPDQEEMTFNPAPPPRPTHEEIVLATACGCTRVVDVPNGIRRFEVPISNTHSAVVVDAEKALSDTLVASLTHPREPRRVFERTYHRKDEEGRAYFTEVVYE